MNASLNPSPLIAEVLPGYVVLGIAAVSYFSAYFTAHPDQWHSLISSPNLLAVVTGLGAASFVASWIIGTVLDSVRDLLEVPLDWVWRVDWDFLFTAPESEIRKTSRLLARLLLLDRQLCSRPDSHPPPE